MKGTWQTMRRELPLLGVLVVAAVLLWTPLAPSSSLIGAGLGALIGAVAGLRLADGRMRTFVPPLAFVPALVLVAVVAKLAAWLPVPAHGRLPELIAATRDAATLAAWSGLGGLLASFLARRVRVLRPLPAGLVVLGCVQLVAAHRGGAIHLPIWLADTAWMRGWHPGLLLAVLGTLAGLLGAMALFRRGRARLPWLQGGAIALLALVLLSALPQLAIYHFSNDDPLGLSGSEKERVRPTEDGREVNARPRGGERDPLGLSGSGSGDDWDELLPFRDEYKRDNSQAPVAVVILHDDVEPMGGAFYFRQVALSQWNGRRLVESYSPDVDRDIFPYVPLAGSLEPRVAPLDAHRQVVPATVALLREHSRPPVLTDGRSLEAAQTADPALFRQAYRSESLVRVGEFADLFGLEAGNPEWSIETLQHYTLAPEDPRYRAIAEEALAALHPAYARDPFAKAVAITLWLQENTRYSLRSKHAGSADPTGSFLFGDRIGYCVHLAHAGVYLMRSLGLPARIGAGYAYEAANRGGGSALLLRAADAHAWAEVYIDGVGWVPLDPSPESLDPEMPMPDADLQRLLGELARPDSERLEGDERVAWILPSFEQVAATLGVLFTLAVLFGLVVKLYRALVARWSRRDQHARLALRASLDRLAELGLRRATGETREHFATRVGELAPSFVDLTAMNLAAHFGRIPADPALAAQLYVATARELARARRARLLAGRWLLPWSWMGSR